MERLKLDMRWYAFNHNMVGWSCDVKYIYKKKKTNKNGQCAQQVKVF